MKRKINYKLLMILGLGMGAVHKLKYFKSRLPHFASVSSIHVCIDWTFFLSPFLFSSIHCNQTSVKKLFPLLSHISKYIPLYSCCCQGWPENSQKRRFDTWFICNRLSLPNPSLCLPIKQPRQIDLRKRNSGGQHQWLGY